MTFEEWYDGYMYWHDEDEVDPEYLIRIAQRAWEAGVEEGIQRMYRLYDICPECKVAGGQHKMDCTRV